MSVQGALCLSLNMHNQASHKHSRTPFASIIRRYVHPLFKKYIYISSTVLRLAKAVPLFHNSHVAHVTIQLGPSETTSTANPSTHVIIAYMDHRSTHPQTDGSIGQVQVLVAFAIFVAAPVPLRRAAAVTSWVEAEVCVAWPNWRIR